MNSKMAIRLAAFQSVHKKVMLFQHFGAATKISSKLMLPVTIKSAKIPKANPKSPTLLTKAFIAAAFALVFYIKNQSEDRSNSTPSHPKNICTRLSEVTNINIAKVK